MPEVTLSFSDLKYFFECPYQFKLRFLYGFNPPIHEALGYGKSVHDVMAEIHKRAIDGDIVVRPGGREAGRPAPEHAVRLPGAARPAAAGRDQGRRPLSRREPSPAAAARSTPSSRSRSTSRPGSRSTAGST